MPSHVAKSLGVLLNKARDDRKKELDPMWDIHMKWFEGDQELGRRSGGQDWKSEASANLIFGHIMTIIPILTNSLPEVSINPIIENPDFQLKAERIKELIDRIHRKNNMITRQSELVMEGATIGMAAFKPTWDGSMRAGLGDVRIGVPKTRSLFFEPGKERFRDMNYIFEVRVLDKLTVLQMYPDKRDMIDELFRKGSKGDEVLRQQEAVQDGALIRNTAAAGAAEKTTFEASVFDMAIGASGDEKATIEVVEAWFTDEATIEDVEKITKGEKFGSKKEEARGGDSRKPAFPFGRLVTFSGLEVLDDRPNPFPGFPYVQYWNYMFPGRPYGMNEIEQLLSQQKQLNIRLNQLNDGLNLTNFRIMLYDHTAGVEPEEIEGRPGGWIAVDDVQGIKVLDVSSPTAGAFNDLITQQRLFEVVGGVREVTQGEVPGDVRSGFAVEQLQEAAQGRLRLKTRYIESAIKELDRYIIRMIGLFYIPGVHYQDDVDLRGINPDFFDIGVKSGVSIASSEFQKQQRHLQWFDRGVVDEEFLIDQSDEKDKDAVKERMKPIWDARKAQLTAPPVDESGQPGLGIVQGGQP